MGGVDCPGQRDCGLDGGPPMSGAQGWRERYGELTDALLHEYRTIPQGSPVRLAKRTSNLFRPRVGVRGPGLDVAGFDGVLEVDPVARTADVLGMTTYEHLVCATLPHGFMPLCVPQLRTITLGGAVTGLGIESSSFRNGAPHESVIEMDVLTGAGEVVTCTRALDDPHRDLFLGFANTYGSLGYALRLRIELEPVKPFVLLRHLPVTSAAALARTLAALVEDGQLDARRIDFLDGTVFSDREMYLTIGSMVDELPPGMTPSDYTGMGIYYRSIQQRRTDGLTIHDYLWRWDTDWFWCSRAFGAQDPRVRRLWPKSKLRSDVYWKLVAFDRRHDVSNRAARLRGGPPREAVVQDIEVPVDRLAEFLGFLDREVRISPVWICPIRQRDRSERWPLYDLDPDLIYVNVGFWSTVPLNPGEDPRQGRVNRRIEEVVATLGGRKSLYSTAFYDRSTFWSIYGGQEYARLKASYDPQGRLPDLFAKVVQRR